MELYLDNEMNINKSVMPLTEHDPPAPTIYANLRGLINVIDELRDAGVHHYINLPRICVVGTQSAGKSSVLEAIVGIDFLPRGEGIVTRRPLELRLEHTADGPDAITFGVFDQDPQKKKMTDFEAVRREIERVTDEVAGKNKGIVDDPIVLSISGPICPDLTLVDLPGITRVPLKGSDQTDEIERLTRDMATRYATDPRTIILAVVPANQDISTSDALQLARKVDPRGLRTIGVITKIDLMDRGTNAARMVAGDDVPLRLGYVAVKNRSQQDIVTKKAIPAALEEEKEFFKNHPVYKSMAPSLFGIHSLVDKLTRVLFKHIRNFLPEIKGEINTKISNVKSRRNELGDGVPIEPNERTQLMWTLINDYCELFRNTIRGKYDRRLTSSFENMQQQDFAGGAQVRVIFNDLLGPMLDNSVTKNMTDYDIDNAMRLHEGDSLPGFPSPDTFEYLILPHLRTIQTPVFDCLEKTAQTLELLSQRVANRVFCRFPHLAAQILELSQEILIREKDHTRAILEYVVTAETSYLFTNDVQYLTEHGSMIPVHKNEGKSGNSTDTPQETQTGAWSLGFSKQTTIDTNSQQQGGGIMSNLSQAAQNMWQPEKKTRYSASFLAEIRRRLDAYFGIVIRNMRDTVPKLIGHFLVRASQDSLQFELYTQLNKVDQYDALLGEPPNVREEREALTEQLKILQKALQILQKDSSITSLCAADTFDDMYEWDLDRQTKGAPPAQPFVQQPPQHTVLQQVTDGGGARAAPAMPSSNAPVFLVAPVNPTAAGLSPVTGQQPQQPGKFSQIVTSSLFGDMKSAKPTPQPQADINAAGAAQPMRKSAFHGPLFK